MTTFDVLADPIQALLRDEGFRAPTAAQRAAIPPILAGKHVLLLAATGMGKTEAAVLPVFHRCLQLPPERGIRVVYVTPLRALNRDLLGRLEDWGSRLGVPVAVRHGDTTQKERAAQARHPPAFLITTPETLQVLLSAPTLRKHLRTVKFVVVDEVHELAEDERGTQLAVALERLASLAGEFQRIGLSATVGDPDSVAGFLGGDRSVVVVRVPVAKALRVTVEACLPSPGDRAAAGKLLASPESAAQLQRCLSLIGSHRSTLLFVNTRETAEVLTARTRMLSPDFPLAVHHGSLSRDARLAAEQAFKAGEAKGLICTSSMELGIDIGTADLVIQYGSPRQVVRLVQRVGRSGHRADLVSNGVVIATDPDDAAEAMVIAAHALAEKLEKFAVPEAPLDVLANQLVAMALDGVTTLDEAHALLRRARPFRGLSRQRLEAVAGLLQTLRLLYTDGGVLRRARGAHAYFYDNLSMIPDHVSHAVLDMASGKRVAQLDEDFVANFLEVGAIFICQGRPWRAVELLQEERLVRVEPVQEPWGAIPSWIGEEIPVPLDVAQDVGKLRSEIEVLLAGAPPDEVCRDIASRYPAGQEAARLVVELVAEQRRAGMEVPTHERLTLDCGAGRAVLNVCLGSKGNEALGRVLSSLLSARLGTSVGITIDPYRVILTLPRGARPELVKDVLLGIEPGALEPLLTLVVQGSGYLRYRLLQVARRFGALDRGAGWKRVRAERLAEVFRSTPIHDEAMREIGAERFELPAARMALERLRSGAWALVVQGLSPIGAAGLDDRRELIHPRRADRSLLEAVRARLSDARVVLACVNCCSWTSRTRVGEVPARPACGKCGALTLAVLRPWHTSRIKLVERHRPKSRGAFSEEEDREWRRLNQNANLVMSQGQNAVVALVARGVGPETAARILLRQHREELEFYREILAAEVSYARTRQFWD